MKAIIGTPKEIEERLSELKQDKRYIVKEQKSSRSNNQNNYFHLLCTIIGNEIGEDYLDVKEMMKIKFLRIETKHGIKTHNTSDLNIEQMAGFTDRIIKWSQEYLNLTLPDPEIKNLDEYYANLLIN